MDGARCAARVYGLWLPKFGDSRINLPGPGGPRCLFGFVPCGGDHPEERCSRVGVATSTRLEEHETTWTWLHKLRRAMVRPGRDLLAGRVEVDECYVAGLEEGRPGRLNLEKARGSVGSRYSSVSR